MDDNLWSSQISDILPFTGATVVRKKGNFKHSSGANYYFQTTDTNDSTFNLRISNCPVTRRIKIYLNTKVTIYADEQAFVGAFALSNTQDLNPNLIIGYYGDNTIESGRASTLEEGDNSNGFKFTKDTILKTEQSPADFLLDYAKLFGLYFIKDRYNKSIHICTRNSFFTGEVKNWSDRIDYLKDVTVTPILFDKKYYLMQLDTPETKEAIRYKTQYSQQYGQQRLSTGYNFNYDSDNFYKENIYQQIIPTIDSDRLFRNFYTNDDDPVPS